MVSQTKQSMRDPQSWELHCSNNRAGCSECPSLFPNYSCQTQNSGALTVIDTQSQRPSSVLLKNPPPSILSLLQARHLKDITLSTQMSIYWWGPTAEKDSLFCFCNIYHLIPPGDHCILQWIPCLQKMKKEMSRSETVLNIRIPSQWG